MADGVSGIYDIASGHVRFLQPQEEPGELNRRPCRAIAERPVALHGGAERGGMKDEVSS